MNDPNEWARNIASLVKGFVGKAVDAVNARIDELEQRVAAVPVPKDGVDGLPGERGADGAPGADGKDGAQGPQGEPGRDGIDGQPGAQGEKGEPGQNGKDADPITAAQLVEAIKSSPELLHSAIAAYLAANPPIAGKDGVDGRDGKDPAPISDEQIARAVASHIALNPPAPGRDGRDGLPGAPGAKGADGVDGKDGRDGLDLRNFSAEVDPSGRTVMLTLSDGERIEHAHLTFPVVIDRGVFREAGPEAGGIYERGDGVTFGGSFWIAQKDAPEGKPGEPGADGWRLAVKRGRDGKDGAPGKDFTPPKPVKLP